MEKIGAFGLTEPDVGSGVAGGLTTTARRDGTEWVLDGQKKWIGNATFADYVIIWARSLEDDQVKGFVVEKGTPGFETSKQKDKIALRVVQNAHITLDGVRVPEENRLQEANSFARHRQGAAADPGRRGLAGHRLRPRRLRARAGLRPPAAAVRPPDRRLPAGPGPAGEDAGQRHRRRPACARGCPRCSRPTWPRITIPRWPRRSARSGCGRRSAGPASCSAATASCWRTTSAGSSPTPRRSTPTRAPARSTR